MTRLYVDKREVAAIPPDLTSLDQVIKLVETNHLSPRSVIRQVNIDGLPLTADGPAACLPARLVDSEMIEVFTGTLSEVAVDSIREAIVYLARIEEAIPSLASSFRNAMGPEAFDNLKQFYEGFYWLNLLLDRLAQSFAISLDSIQIGDMSGSEHHQNLIATLKAVIEAHEKSDFGLVADLLAYEMLPLVPVCRLVFGAIRERIVSEP